MAEPTKITSHYDEILSLMPTQFLDKPNIDGLLQTWFGSVQELEDDFWDMFTDTRFFDAKGVNLDRYGTSLGLTRPEGQTDIEFFGRVAGTLLARASDGSVDSIREVVEAVYGLVDTEIIETNNVVEWEANAVTDYLTGAVLVYGYYNRSDRLLAGNEGDFLKKACPVTTKTAIYGQHTQFSKEENNLFIPCEVILQPDQLGVEIPPDPTIYEVGTDAVGTDTIGLTGTNFKTYGDNWELAILPEDSSGGGRLSVNDGTGFETMDVETKDTGVEVFLVQTEGIETNHGILLEIATSS